MKTPASTPNTEGGARRRVTPRADPKHAPRARRAPFALLILGLVIGGMCALLALNTASAANEVSRAQFAGDDESVAAQVAQLENDVAASAAPDNLASAAAELGMVPAGNPAFLVVGADGKVRLLGSPAAASANPVYVAPKTAKKSPSGKTTAKKTSSLRGTKAGTPTTASSKTARPSKTGTPTSARTTSGTKSPSPHRQPTTPRPTPTPNTTLPGGTR